MITPEKLAEWEKLCDEATPGPWDSDNNEVIGFLDGTGVVAIAAVCQWSLTDVKFIAESRTAMPELIAEVNRLREALGFYADKKNYEEFEQKIMGNAGISWSYKTTKVKDDDGLIARKALGVED